MGTAMAICPQCEQLWDKKDKNRLCPRCRSRIGGAKQKAIQKSAKKKRLHG